MRYEGSLADFTAAAWHCVEPRAFLSNWHIDAICEHLEALAEWQIKRLLINIPPRHMKSLAVNVFFPAWVWAPNPNPENDPTYHYHVRRNGWLGPGVKFMHLSYEGRLATRDGKKCRDLIKSDWYQRRWSHRVQLHKDQNQKTRFENLRGGYRLSTSESGVITGEGADIVVFDDPHNVRKIATSDMAREATLQFWDEALPSRLNDPEHGAFILIMQRVHERDLSGHILERESGWTHLCLPAEYESNHPFPIRTSVTCKATGEIWRDPRQEGELLWPEQFSRDALHAIAKDQSMSSHVAAGQLQQRPTARDGGMFKRAWFAHEIAVLDIDSFVALHGLELVRAWDLAWSGPDCGGDPDFSVGVLMGLEPDSNLCYILDVARGRWAAKQIEQMVMSRAACDGEACAIRIPQDPGAGKFVAGHLATKLGGYDVRRDSERASKPARAAPLAAHAENGLVVLARAPWNQSFVDELCAFPNGAHDDQVDAAAAAYRALMSRVRYTAVAA